MRLTVGSAASPATPAEGTAHRVVVAPCLTAASAPAAAPRPSGSMERVGGGSSSLLDVAVHADLHPLAPGDLGLEPVGGVGDLGDEPAVLDAGDDAVEHRAGAASSRWAKTSSACRSSSSVSSSTNHEPPSGSATCDDAGLLGDDLLGAQREPGRAARSAGPAPRRRSRCAGSASRRARRPAPRWPRGPG